MVKQNKNRKSYVTDGAEAHRLRCQSFGWKETQ